MKHRKISEAISTQSKIKKQNPNALVLIELGDFYEALGEDAIILSKELGINLLSRELDGERTPLCGVPSLALDKYTRELAQKGYEVIAICERKR
jgi:DNA mismatch repair protein MutS